MNNKEPGYVYILTRSTSGRLHICKNPSFREDWVKIGKSSRPVDVRSKELDNTFVPLSFEKRAQRFLPLLCPWMTNKVQPSVEQLYEIAHHLDVDVKELLVSSK